MKKEATTGKIAVIYARYSSANQRDVSIEQQVAACQKYADSQDLQIMRVYDDHAMTGTNDNRPSFQQMIKDSSLGVFNYVIIYSLDRFSRNKYDAVINKKILRDNGVKVLSATEHISDDPTGQLMESILEGFAQYYSDELSSKVKRGHRSNAEKCMVLGQCPFGYKRGDDGRFAIVPEEAAVVKEIFQRVANCEPFADIFRDLNDRGIKTKHKGEWNKCSFDKLLHCKKYIGIYEYHDTRNGYEDIYIEDGIPRIIDDELFYTVQEYCKEKPRSRSNPQRRRREDMMYLLTGKLFCGRCKGAMVGKSGTGKGGSLFYYYVCKNHTTDKSCSKMPVPKDQTEKRLAMTIHEIISQPNVVEFLADGIMEYLDQMNNDDDSKLIRDRLDVIAKEKKNILANMQRITLDVLLDDLQTAYEKLTVEESSLKAKLIVAEAKKKKDLDRDSVIAFCESYSRGDIDDKKYQEVLFDTFLRKAYLYDDHFHLIIKGVDGDNEIDIPIEVEDAIGVIDSKCLNTLGTPSESVRIGSAASHHRRVMRTPRFIVQMICGLAVVTGRID